MSRIVNLHLDNQTTFFAEVDEEQEIMSAGGMVVPRDGLVYAAGGEGVSEGVTRTVAGAMESMRPVIGKVLETVRALGPEECQVEFGLKLNGEVGIFVSKGGAEAHIKVTMKWKSAAP